MSGLHIYEHDAAQKYAADWDAGAPKHRADREQDACSQRLGDARCVVMPCLAQAGGLHRRVAS